MRLKKNDHKTNEGKSALYCVNVTTRGFWFHKRFNFDFCPIQFFFIRFNLI